MQGLLCPWDLYIIHTQGVSIDGNKSNFIDLIFHVSSTIAEKRAKYYNQIQMTISSVSGTVYLKSKYS